jgi:hypothetical protein
LSHPEVWTELEKELLAKDSVVPDPESAVGCQAVQLLRLECKFLHRVQHSFSGLIAFFPSKGDIGPSEMANRAIWRFSLSFGSKIVKSRTSCPFCPAS